MNTDHNPDESIRAALARVAGTASDGARVHAALARRPRLHRQRRTLLLAGGGAIALGATVGPAMLLTQPRQPGRTEAGPTNVPAPPTPPPPAGDNRLVPMRWRPTWLPDGYVETGRLVTVDDPAAGFQQRTWHRPGGTREPNGHRIYLQTGPSDWFGVGYQSWRSSATRNWRSSVIFDEPRQVAQVIRPLGPDEMLAVALPHPGADGMRLAQRIADSVVADQVAGCEISLELGWLPAPLSGNQLVNLDGGGNGSLAVELRVESSGSETSPMLAALGLWTIRARCDEQVTVRGRSGCGWADETAAGLFVGIDRGRELYMSVDLSTLTAPPELSLPDVVRIADSLRIGPPPDASWAGHR